MKSKKILSILDDLRYEVDVNDISIGNISTKKIIKAIEAAMEAVEENKKLRKENKKLKLELSAFNLEEEDRIM